MADNVTITAGVGTSIATDDIGGVQYQRVKLSQGADGSATDVSSAAPLQVTLANTGANATAVKVDASSVAVPVTDNSGSLTVDAPVGTPVYVRLSDGGAAITALPVTDNSSSLTVDNAGTFAVQATVAAGATNIAKAEDAASADADVGIPAMAVRKATPANTSGTDGDYEMLQMSAGRLWTSSDVTLGGTALDGNSGNKSNQTLRVVLATDQPQLTNKLLVTPDANSAVNVAQMNGVAVTMGNGAAGTGVQRVAIASDNTVLPGVGAGATGSAVPANAVLEGAVAKTALPSAGTDGNLVGVMADKFGRQVMHLAAMRDLVGTQTTTISASTSETTIVTAGATGVFNDLVMLIVSNTSASTNTRIDIRDATSGSVIFSLQSNGGQNPVGFVLPVPIPQTTAANNWTAQCATSTTDIRIYAVFVKNK